MKKGFLGIDTSEFEQSGQVELPEVNEMSLKEIAVIGMAVKMPMAEDIDAFWDNIKNGVDCMREFPPERKEDVEKYLKFKYGTSNAVWDSDIAWLQRIDGFDYGFFSLSPKEAVLMDPHQRIFLQTSWQAIEDAGYGGDRLVGTRTGVYIGHTGDRNYLKIIADLAPSELTISVPGNIPQIVAGRISYLLNLKGPNIVIDTTCSSSLVALHLACQGMRNGECEMALVGGIKLQLACAYGEERFAVLSPDGRCRTFDDNSEGMGVGEGAGAVLLKPLNRALEDGDNIYAVIKGSAVNHDGSSIGITAPSPSAQKDVIARAWLDAGIDPRTIRFIESHGTGTKLGDPIEIQGIERAFERYTEEKQFCAVGSIKTNIGHLDSAAGIAGFIKAVLALKNKTIPPSIHLNKPNSRISFEKSPVYINTRLKEWDAYRGVRRCGVSSFGLGGTNCHVVLEQAPEVSETHMRGRESGAYVLTISSKSLFSMEKLVNRYKEFLENPKGAELKDICFTSCVGRGHYKYRLAVIADHVGELREKLQQFSIDSFSNREGLFYGIHRVVSRERELQEGSVITEERKTAQTRIADKEVEALLSGEKNRRECLEELCRLYIAGADINWKKVYSRIRPKLVRLPVYPFDEKRCWLKVPDTPEVRNGNLATPYYSAYWEKVEKIKDSGIPGGRRGTVLVFVDNGERSKDAAQILDIKGWNVIEVRQGDRFNENSPNRYIVGQNQESYTKLLRKVKDRCIAKVLHFACLDGDSGAESVEEVRNALNSGVLSIFYLSRAILEAGVRDEVEILMLAQHAWEVDGKELRINPAGAAMFGLGKSIGMENIRIKCRCMDIDESTDGETVVQELEQPEKEYQVAYREGVKYVHALKKVNFKEVEERNVEIRENGVYMIAGGTGGIGLEFAKHLASKKKVTLALIGRSPVDEPGRTECSQGSGTARYEAVRHIEEKGSSVLFYCADIANEKQLGSVLEDIRKKHGRINGVINCAGVAGNGFLSNKEESVFWEVLNPKTLGTWLLEALTRQDELDFFLMCSSVTSLTGGPGQGDYTAASAYMDSFEAYGRRKGREMLVIDWAAWENIGMDALRKGKRESIVKKLSPRQALEYFDFVMRKKICRIMIGELDYVNMGMMEKTTSIFPFRLHAEIRNELQPIRDKSGIRYSGRNAGQVFDVKLKGRKDNTYTTTEKLVAQAWGEVLGFEEIDIHDTFYELGGDSILAIKIVNRINEKAGVKEEIVEMLRRPTVFEYSSYLEGRLEGAEKKREMYLDLKSAGPKDYYPLSSAQKRLYIHWQIQKDNIAYNMPSAIAVKGEVDSLKLEQAVKKLIKRHESLRTSFETMDGFPVQRIHENIDFKLEHIAAGDKSTEEILRQFIRPFDLSVAPLIRVCMADKGRDGKLLLFDMHHIISDAISIGLLLKDFSELYDDGVLPPLEVQYKDFAEWQIGLFTSGAFDSQEKYWLKKLEKLEYTVLENPKVPAHSLGGASRKHTLEKRIVNRIGEFCGRNKITRFVFMLTAFKTALYKETGQENISVGIPVSGRNHSLLEKLVGIFLNVLVITTYADQEKTYQEFLKAVEGSVMEALDNQEYPYDELYSKIRDESGFMFETLFSIFFNYLPAERDITIKLGNAVMEALEFEDAIPKHDITMYVKEQDSRIILNAVYKRDLYDDEVIERLLANYCNVIETVLNDENILLKDITTKRDALKEHVLENFDELFENDEFAI